MDELVGMTKVNGMSCCKETGLTPRITSEDGELFAITNDLKFDRVNLQIVDGIII